jgi:hypothetical protein
MENDSIIKSSRIDEEITFNPYYLSIRYVNYIIFFFSCIIVCIMVIANFTVSFSIPIFLLSIIPSILMFISIKSSDVRRFNINFDTEELTVYKNWWGIKFHYIYFDFNLVSQYHIQQESGQGSDGGASTRTKILINDTPVLVWGDFNKKTLTEFCDLLVYSTQENISPKNVRNHPLYRQMKKNHKINLSILFLITVFIFILFLILILYFDIRLVFPFLT